jgi:hypothetical protein
MVDNLASIVQWISDNSSIGHDFPWSCPFCGKDATIGGANRASGGAALTAERVNVPHVATSVFVVCPNPGCKKFTLTVLLNEAEFVQGHGYRAKISTPNAYWQLIPTSDAKVYPEYVPKPVRNDYTEACLIRDLSPKASATLSRRCLQGMIRDFFGVTRNNLYLEIEAVKDKVAPLTWHAISAVRGVGNIGAHMERDINVIVDVEPQEAAMLTGLIEVLIEDWYISRHERQRRLEGIVALGDAKKRAKTGAPPLKDPNGEIG